jgi:hypothetical protein
MRLVSPNSPLKLATPSLRSNISTCTDTLRNTFRPNSLGVSVSCISYILNIRIFALGSDLQVDSKPARLLRKDLCRRVMQGCRFLISMINSVPDSGLVRGNIRVIDWSAICFRVPLLTTDLQYQYPFPKRSSFSYDQAGPNFGAK